MSYSLGVPIQNKAYSIYPEDLNGCCGILKSISRSPYLWKLPYAKVRGIWEAGIQLGRICKGIKCRAGFRHTSRFVHHILAQGPCKCLSLNLSQICFRQQLLL